MKEHERDCFLGVSRSLGGRRWIERRHDSGIALALAQRLALPEIVGRVLAGRGVSPDRADAFLSPRLRDLLPDPSHLRDMDRAAKRLAAAVIDGEPVAILGDYDVDGAASTALLKRFLRSAGRDCETHIPDRIEEGYGPSAQAVERLRAAGARVLVTLDCGTTAFEALAAAAACGLDTIVIDHHVAEARLPEAWAVVNPNRLDEDSEHRQIAAVGVTFLLVVAVNRELRSAGWYRSRGLSEPNLMELLDLVALGTVCDVVPLTGLNRPLVAQGLKVMARRGNVGLAALADVAGVRERPDPYHLGFVLGPRINAGGRVGTAGLGARLLSTSDAGEALEIATALERLNAERRAIEDEVMAAAIACVERRDADDPVIVVAGEGWHPGVIGIVASRLVERFGRPACVVSLMGEEGKGSARSVPGFAIGPAVIAARQAGLLSAGGGHAMAAGFSVRAERLDELRLFLSERCTGARSADRSQPCLTLDGALSPAAATGDLVALLQQAGPYGAGHDEPCFVLPSARIARADIVGERHVRCFLTGVGGGRLKAIAFRSLGTPVGDALLARDRLPLHIAGRLRPDEWAGPGQVQLLIADAAPCAAN